MSDYKRDLDDLVGEPVSIAEPRRELDIGPLVAKPKPVALPVPEAPPVEASPEAPSEPLLGPSILDYLTPAVREALRKRLESTAPVVKRIPYAKRQSYTVPVTATLEPQTTTNVCVQTQRIFRCSRTVAVESEPGATKIVSAFVGSLMQFPPTGEIPTSMIGPSALAENIVCDTVRPGTMVTFQVRNDSDKRVNWNLVMIGEAIV